MFDIFNMLKKDEAKAVKQVTRETIIGDILDMDQRTAPYIIELGMHCLGCPASPGERIEEASEVNGVVCDVRLDKQNAQLASKKDRVLPTLKPHATFASENGNDCSGCCKWELSLSHFPAGLMTDENPLI